MHICLKMDIAIFTKKNILLSIFLLVAGYFCFYADAMLLSHYFSKLVFIVLKLIRESSNSRIINYFILFFMLNIQKIILVFFFTFSLSYKFKIKTPYLIFFFIGSAGFSFYYNLEAYIYYNNYYDVVPSWATSSFYKSILALLIIEPCVILAGSYAGSKSR